MEQLFCPVDGSPFPCRLALLSALTAFFASFLAAFNSASASPTSPIFPEVGSPRPLPSPSGASLSPELLPDPTLACCLAFRRCALHDLLHVVTSSQHFSHFFLHVNGRLHVTHIFCGRFSFFTPCTIFPPPPLAALRESTPPAEARSRYEAAAIASPPQAGCEWGAQGRSSAPPVGATKHRAVRARNEQPSSSGTRSPALRI
mmetsp:Transcript_44312/g.110951  ORF Transcript_44312/g.110951 Transcript_44312/m.110951 type:complete len:202 (+) Transcript_44312:190-795(+)|eukprot:CAMPEP_0173466696 /NCGR_PEP_ID=MMETSP1357-20121228/73761_1 /TAXON_ID=77926 /ORGANISM="Hemiselmis rufescens, Strain PCC563" /LENGTH=201 /DNA_ID=CAMNT_0014434771 /DNA_START=129 /DNA_END=731 /DNA_ORIENTATION=+